MGPEVVLRETDGKFDADGKKEKYDAYLGHDIYQFLFLDEPYTVRAYEHAAKEKACNGGKPQAMKDDRCDYRCRKEDYYIS